MPMSAAVQAVSQGIFPVGNDLGWIFQLIWLVFFVVFMFYGQRIQMTVMLREIAGSLYKLRLMRDKGRSMAISRIKELANPNDDPTPRVDRFLEHIYIQPVDLDPVGIIQRLEHIIDVRDLRFRDDVRSMAPQADETQIDNLTMVLEAALDLNQIYKIIRHFYLQGKKTLSIYTVMQLQMILPIVMKLSEALANALRAFTLGQPFGDGAGCLVAGRLMHGSEKREIAKDIVVGDVMVEGRRAYVLKAKGPGGRVGRPGEAIKQILEENEGKVSMIILIDAAVKLEGEKVGEVAEGIGVAIGPAGVVDKYKVEETATKYKVPLNAIIIKEDLADAYSIMKKEIVDGAEVAVERIKQLIREKTKEGDTVIVAGIGNTMGVGQ